MSVEVEIEGRGGIATEEMTLNMGPQHPSTHGVLRFIVKADGDDIAVLKVGGPGKASKGPCGVGVGGRDCDNEEVGVGGGVGVHVVLPCW